MSFALKNHLFEKSEWKSLDRKLNEKMTENPLCYSYTTMMMMPAQILIARRMKMFLPQN